MSDRSKIQKELSAELAKVAPDPQKIARLSDALLDNTGGAVRFTVDAQHINRLGLELVGKQETALSELIKNAYDADATEVKITFQDFDKPGGTLVISDDGVGMNIDAVRNSWMRLSTNDKGDHPVSGIYARRRAGRKGIGRFAVQRLGKSLTLETSERGKPLGLRVVFDWDKNFSAGKNLSQIWHDIETFEKDRDQSGTTLTITHLRDRWTEKTLERVWKSVLFLQPPVKPGVAAEGQPSEGLSVSINGVSSRQQEIKLSIEDNFLNNAIAQISGSIDANGTAEFSVVSDKLGVNESHTSDEKFLLVGPVTLSASYFIYLASLMSGISVRIATDMGSRYGGIRVYRNGFRVLPYGEPSDDWLKLSFDAARRNTLVPANNHNFFGHVDIEGDANPLLEETSSREGFVENEAFEELQSFCRRCVEWAATRIASARKKKTTASQPDFERTYTRKPSELILQRLENERKDTGSGQSTRNEAEIDEKNGATSDNNTLFLEDLFKQQKEFEDDVQEKINLSVEYENMLRILASLGISVSLFGHEIKSANNAVDNSLAVAEIDVEKLKDASERRLLETDLTSLKSATDRIFDLGSYVESLVSKTRSRELTEVHFDTAIRRFLTQFQSYLHKRHINFEISTEPLDLKSPNMHASELDSILFNLLTNSVKAIENNNANDPRIRITCRRNNDYVVLSFEDNGIGINHEIGERVFDAFFTTTEVDGDSISGMGTGLGLKIVSDIASAYGGEALLSDELSDGFNTRIDVSLRSVPNK